MATRVRILAFPFFKQNWLIHARVVAEICEQRAAKAAGKVAKAEAASPEKYAPGWIVAYGKQALDKMLATWDGWGQAPKGSVTKRLHNLGTWALDRIDPDETMMRDGLPQVASSIEVAYPSSLSPAEVREKLNELVGTRTDAMRRSFWFNVIPVGLFMPLMLTPISNVPVYWFSFRAWSTWRASNGGLALRTVLDSTDAEIPSAAQVVDLTAEFKCRRLNGGSRENGGSEEGTVTAGGDEVLCCRLNREALPGAPPVLLVPCDAMERAVRPSAALGGEILSLEAAAEVESVYNTSGVVELTRKIRAKLKRNNEWTDS